MRRPGFQARRYRFPGDQCASPRGETFQQHTSLFCTARNQIVNVWLGTSYGRYSGGESPPGCMEMRMKFHLVASLAATIALASASPAYAGKSNVQTLPAPVAPCDLGLTTPDASACSGYYSGNLINGSSTDLQAQADAIALLPGDYEFDTSTWADVEATKVLTLTGPDSNQIDFGTTLF